MGCNCDPNGPNMDRALGLHILSHSAHIGVHGDPVVSHWDPIPHPSECTWGSFGSHSRPIQHHPGGRGAHSDRNCVRFSTHQGVRKPVFDVPKKMTHTTNACFLVFCRPKILGRQKSEPRGNHFCVLLGFRRSRGNKKQQIRAATVPMPSPAGIFCRGSCRRGTNGAQMGRVRCP